MSRKDILDIIILQVVFGLIISFAVAMGSMADKQCLKPTQKEWADCGIFSVGFGFHAICRYENSPAVNPWAPRPTCK